MLSTPERLHAPSHFQNRLRQVGGTNRYGDANFKLAWAQTETTRQGGEWEADGEWFKGYRDVYLGDGLPHWMLLQWADAGKNITMPHLNPESDASFYMQNECPKTGLQLLGEYPYHGSYQIALPLVAKWFEGGQLKLRAFPLSTEILNMMVPIIKASMEISLQAKLMFMKEQSEKDDDVYAKAVDDAYNSIKLSASARSSKWIADKERSLEKHFNAALVTMMARNRQFQSTHAI
jgi:hypothetical protein